MVLPMYPPVLGDGRQPCIPNEHGRWPAPRGHAPLAVASPTESCTTPSLTVPGAPAQHRDATRGSDNGGLAVVTRQKPAATVCKASQQDRSAAPRRTGHGDLYALLPPRRAAAPLRGQPLLHLLERGLLLRRQLLRRIFGVRNNNSKTYTDSPYLMAGL